MTFSLPSASLDLKVPIENLKARTRKWNGRKLGRGSARAHIFARLLLTRHPYYCIWEPGTGSFSHYKKGESRKTDQIEEVTFLSDAHWPYKLLSYIIALLFCLQWRILNEMTGHRRSLITCLSHWKRSLARKTRRSRTKIKSRILFKTELRDNFKLGKTSGMFIMLWRSYSKSLISTKIKKKLTRAVQGGRMRWLLYSLLTNRYAY